MATKAHLVIDQGTSFTTDLNLTDDNGDPLHLYNYTANSLIKKWYTSQTSIPFTTSINVDSGAITLSLDANTTASLMAGRYVYDVDVTQISTNTVSRILEGMVTVTPSVTAGIYSTNTTWYANGYSDG